MTLKFKNVYINNNAVVAGPYLIDGPLAKYFDGTYDDFYDNEKTYEDCEIKEAIKCINLLLEKEKENINDIDLLISGDLSNQIMISSFVAKELHIPYLGVYSACSSFTEELIVAATLIDKKVKKVLCLTTAHNLTAERQFRSPTEYGAPKPSYSTFTASSATASIITNNKGIVRIESGTIGRVIDLDVKDSFDMGSAMAPAAADTLNIHLKDTKRNIDYYDLILTGDLGIYGEKIFKEYCKEVYGYNLTNYDDAATNIYNNDNKETLAGGSGPSCLPCYLYTKIFDKLKNGKIKRILLLATGALLSTTSVNQKKSIPCISHAISLEVV